MEEGYLSLKPELQEWLKVRDYLTQFAKRFHLPEATAITIQLVCEEWFLNIVKHGFAGKTASNEQEDAIQFHMLCTAPREIQMTFIDSAPSFNPLQHPVPNTELPAHQREQGGLGIYLIRKKMDECKYDRIDGHNHFTMIKRF